MVTVSLQQTGKNGWKLRKNMAISGPCQITKSPPGELYIGRTNMWKGGEYWYFWTQGCVYHDAFSIPKDSAQLSSCVLPNTIPPKRRELYPKHLLGIVLSLCGSLNHTLDLSWENSSWHRPKHPRMKQDGSSQASICPYVHLPILSSCKTFCRAVRRLDWSQWVQTVFKGLLSLSSLL